MKKYRAIKRSFFASLSRLIGTMLGAGAGSLLYQITGGGLTGFSAGVILASISFGLLWFIEFEREVE